MSHFWHKPLNLVASGALVFAMVGIGIGGASAAKPHHPSAKNSRTLIFSDYEAPTTANPMTISVVVELSMVDNNLAFGQGPYYDQKVRLRPGFLTSLPKPSHNGTVYKASLRHGLKWSDGKPLNNRDLLFGWHVYMNAGYCSGTCDNITKISLRGKRGVVFHLAHPSAIFAQYQFPPFIPHFWGRLGSGKDRKACLKAVAGCGPIVTKLTGDPSMNYHDASFVTAGPYKASSWAANDTRVTFKPNKFWNNSFVGEKRGKPHLKHLIFAAFTPQDPGLINAAATGETDVTQDFTLLQVKHLRQHKDHQYKVVTQATFNPEQLFFNVGFKDATVEGLGGSTVFKGKNPVYNKKVRLALGLAFKRPNLIHFAYGVPMSIAKRLYSYTSPVLCDKALPSPYCNRSIKGAWDPLSHKWLTPGSKKAIKAAKKLMKKSGYSGSHPATIYLSTNATDNLARKGIYLYLHKAWAKIHVNLNLVDVSASLGGKFLVSYSQGGIAAHSHFQIALFAFGLGIPQPDSLRTSLASQYCPSKDPTVKNRDFDGNDSCINNKAMDKAWNKAESTANNKVRAKQFKKIQVIMSKNAYWTTTDVRPNVNTVDKKARGVKGNPFDSDAANWNSWDWKAAS